MEIWIDADACPNVIKKIIFRAAERTKTIVKLVSNKPLRSPPSIFINKCVVAAGFDMVDNHIIEAMQAGDLVITADIPLANAVVDKGGTALNPRGELYTKDNIKQRLSMRNLSDELRNTGMVTTGSPKLSNKENLAFANSLDRFLTQALKKK